MDVKYLWFLFPLSHFQSLFNPTPSVGSELFDRVPVIRENQIISMLPLASCCNSYLLIPYFWQNDLSKLNHEYVQSTRFFFLGWSFFFPLSLFLTSQVLCQVEKSHYLSQLEYLVGGSSAVPSQADQLLDLTSRYE